MFRTEKIYADLDLTFNQHPGKKDILLSYNDQAVMRAIKNILSTNFFERPFQPNIGSNINALLFEPINDITASILEGEIRNTLSNFESRATIHQISIDPMPDENSFFVRATFFIGNNTTPTAVNLLLQRDR